MRLLLVNPNTSRATTAAMLDIARAAAGPGVAIEAETARFGAPLITDADELARAGEAVAEILARTTGYDGVIVAAFGRSGPGRRRERVRCPVTGIAEAGMAEAAASGRRFAVVTTTPDLADAIAATAAGYGHADRFVGTRLTPGDPRALMADPAALRDALLSACAQAAADGAGAIVIGGGPLAAAARDIAGRCPAPLVEPLPAAVRLAVRRAGQAAKTSP